MTELSGIFIGVLFVAAVGFGFATFINDAGQESGNTVNLTGFDQSDTVISKVKQHEAEISENIGEADNDLKQLTGTVGVLKSVFTSSVTFFYNFGSVVAQKFNGIIPVKFTHILEAAGIVILIFAVLALFLNRPKT